MAFWSGEKLKEELPKLIPTFNDKAIDCSAYTLTVGEEYYITPDHENPAPSTHTKSTLGVGESFAIPSGQFGFILTEEEIKVPKDAMAFISIKSGMKFKGLINASGFHVDPGYNGKLIFSVFNAGPSSIHLDRGMELFLIWYADLIDGTDEYSRKKDCYKTIPSELINGISGEIHSVRSLSDKLRQLEKESIEKVHALDKRLTWLSTIFGVILVILVGIFGYLTRESITNFFSENNVNTQQEETKQKPPER